MKYGEITEKIIGVAFKAHSTLGNGFQEVIYQRALEIEFKKNNIDYAGSLKCLFIMMVLKLVPGVLTSWCRR